MVLQRCTWATHTQMEADYHDREWGVPVHDERTLFEFLTLEGAQAGLSWRTILAKRAEGQWTVDRQRGAGAQRTLRPLEQGSAQTRLQVRR